MLTQARPQRSLGVARPLPTTLPLVQPEPSRVAVLLNRNARHVDDKVVPGAQPVAVPKDAIVLHFAPGETAAKTVYVLAPTDGVAEGDRKVVVSHSVISADAAFDTLDHGRASIRWMTNSRPAFGGIGQRHVDPRSGEILHAGISLESLDARNVRSVRSQILAPPPGGQAAPAHSVTTGEGPMPPSPRSTTG